MALQTQQSDWNMIFGFTRDCHICNGDINSSKLVQHRNLLYSLFRNLFSCFRVTLCSTSTWAILFSEGKGLKVSRNFTQNWTRFPNFSLYSFLSYMVKSHRIHTHLVTWSTHTWSHDPHTLGHMIHTHSHTYSVHTHFLDGVIVVSGKDLNATC